MGQQFERREVTLTGRSPGTDITDPAGTLWVQVLVNGRVLDMTNCIILVNFGRSHPGNASDRSAAPAASMLVKAAGFSIVNLPSDSPCR